MRSPARWPAPRRACKRSSTTTGWRMWRCAGGHGTWPTLDGPPSREQITGRLQRPAPVRLLRAADAAERVCGAPRLGMEIRRGRPGEHFDAGADAARQRVEVVAALESQDHAATAVPGGDLLHRAAEGGEALVADRHFGEGIGAMGVEAGGDEDQL